MQKPWMAIFIITETAMAPECDTVLHRRNGSYALLEVKLGGEDHINAGAASMIELARNIDTDKCRHHHLWQSLSVSDSMPIKGKMEYMSSP